MIIKNRKFVFLVYFLCIFTILLFTQSIIIAKEIPKVIKIGVTYPMSGPLAAFGRVLKQGLDLAEDIVNNKYPELDIPIAKWEGIPNLDGAKIKIILMDDRATPSLGADLTKKLIKDDEVVGMMGCYCSGVTKAASAIAEKYQIPFLNAASASSDLTTRGFNWFWRAGPHSESNSQVLYEFLTALSEGKVKGVEAVPLEDINDVVIVSENTEFGASASTCQEKDAEPYGFNVKKTLLYPHGSPDLSTEVITILAEKPDCIFHNPYCDDAILFIKAYKSMKAQPNILWSNACVTNPDFVKAVKKDAVGLLSINDFSPKVGEKKLIAKQINDLIRERTGEDFTGASARAFTGIQVWARVLNNAASLEPKALQKAFNELFIPEEETIMHYGIKFDKSGPHRGHNSLAKRLVVQYYYVQEGKELPELEVVWPSEYAKVNMIYPFPGWK